MGQMEINPKELYNELKAMQEREFNRQISEALAGRKLTPVERKQLTLEIEASTRFENGELLAVDEFSSPLHDDHGWPVSVQQHIRQTAKTLLGVTEAPQAQAAKPANPDEYFKMMKAATTPEERLAISRAYTGQ